MRELRREELCDNVNNRNLDCDSRRASQRMIDCESRIHSFGFLSLGDQFLDLCQFIAADITCGEQMAHEVRQAALKQTVEQVLGHVACHRLLVDGSMIDEGASFDTM